VLDLAHGHLLALDALGDNSSIFSKVPSEPHYKAYNLGKGNGKSVFQIIEAMKGTTGFDYKTEVVGRRQALFVNHWNTRNLPCFFRKGDVPDLTADPTLAEKELGFKASRDFKSMCEDLWNWQIKNPRGYDEDSDA
jgi:UDP-glucose 4-epimerase